MTLCDIHAAMNGKEEDDDNRDERSWKEVGKMAVSIALPIFFIYTVLVGYVFVVFAAFNMFDSISWKVFISLLAQGIKVLGNKAMLKLMKGWFLLLIN